MSMMDEESVESLRRDIGEKMARDGEPIGENASASLKEGFRRGNMGFGSNVVPRNFGKGSYIPKDWKCVCGNVNSGRIKKKLAGYGEICWLCEQPRSFSEDHG